MSRLQTSKKRNTEMRPNRVAEPKEPTPMKRSGFASIAARMVHETVKAKPKSDQTRRRENRRNAWLKAVRKRDGDVCQFCKGRANQTHHLFTAGSYPELKYEVWNGIRFCAYCHLQRSHGFAGSDREMREWAYRNRPHFTPHYDFASDTPIAVPDVLDVARESPKVSERLFRETWSLARALDEDPGNAMLRDLAAMLRRPSREPEVGELVGVMCAEGCFVGHPYPTTRLYRVRYERERGSEYLVLAFLDGEPARMARPMAMCHRGGPYRVAQEGRR